MTKKTDIQKIIANTDQALADVNTLNTFINSLESPDSIGNKPLPNVVNELTTESDTTKKYSEMFGTTAGVLVSSVATSVVSSTIGSAPMSIGALSLGIGSSIGLGSIGLGSIGLGVFNPLVGVALIASSVTAIILKDSKIRSYKKSHSTELDLARTESIRSKEKISEWISECQKQIDENNKSFNESIKEFNKKFKKKAQELSKKVAIQFDDMINTDINKRILQYNEVILDQYKNQQALEKRMEELVISYNSLLEENKRLVQIIEKLTVLLTSLGVSGSVIEAIAGEQSK